MLVVYTCAQGKPSLRMAPHHGSCRGQAAKVEPPFSADSVPPLVCVCV